MGIKINIDKDVEKSLSKLEKEMINNLKQKIESVSPKVIDDVADVATKKLNEFYNISVMNFYASYPHPIYDRRGSLYNLFNIKREGDTLKYWFEPSEITYRNGYGGEDGLYTTVFKEGWHGGANINGEMLVPYRIPPQIYDGDKRPYLHGKAKWKPAVRSLSPYDAFIALKEDYERNGFRKDYRDIWIRQLNNIGFKTK